MKYIAKNEMIMFAARYSDGDVIKKITKGDDENANVTCLPVDNARRDLRLVYAV